QIELANVGVEPANRKLRQDRKRRALDIDRVVTERDYLVIFEPRQVRLGAKVRAPDRIGVNETRESQRLAEPAAARVLEVHQRFHRRTHLQAAVQRHHFRRRLLRSALEAVGAAVVGVKTRMPLKDEIALSGKPPRQGLRMLKDGILPAVVIELGVRLRSE